MISIVKYVLKIILINRKQAIFTAISLLMCLLLINLLYIKPQKSSSIPISIIDADESVFSESLIQSLEHNEIIDIKKLTVEETDKMLVNGQIEAVITIKQGFEEQLYSGSIKGLIEMRQAPSTYSTGVIKEIVNGEALKLFVSSKSVDTIIKAYSDIGYTTNDKDVISMSESIKTYLQKMFMEKPLLSVEYYDALVLSQEQNSKKSNNLKEFNKFELSCIGGFIILSAVLSAAIVMKEKKLIILKRLNIYKNGLFKYTIGTFLAIILYQLLMVFILILSIMKIQEYHISYLFNTGIKLIMFIIGTSGMAVMINTLIRSWTGIYYTMPLLILINGLFGTGIFFGISKPINTICMMLPLFWLNRYEIYYPYLIVYCIVGIIFGIMGHILYSKSKNIIFSLYRFH